MLYNCQFTFPNATVSTSTGCAIRKLSDRIALETGKRTRAGEFGQPCPCISHDIPGPKAHAGSIRRGPFC